MRWRRDLRPSKPNTGRASSSNYITPGMSFTGALHSKTEESQQRHPSQATEKVPATVDQPRLQTKRQETGQSVPALTVNSDPVDMFRAETVVQQIMAGLKGAVSEEVKILTITINLMNEVVNSVHRPPKS
jgi:hypothetical protein